MQKNTSVVCPDALSLPLVKNCHIVAVLQNYFIIHNILKIWQEVFLKVSSNVLKCFSSSVLHLYFKALTFLLISLFSHLWNKAGLILWVPLQTWKSDASSYISPVHWSAFLIRIKVSLFSKLWGVLICHMGKINFFFFLWKSHSRRDHTFMFGVERDAQQKWDSLSVCQPNWMHQEEMGKKAKPHNIYTIDNFSSKWNDILLITKKIKAVLNIHQNTLWIARLPKWVWKKLGLQNSPLTTLKVWQSSRDNSSSNQIPLALQPWHNCIHWRWIFLNLSKDIKVNEKSSCRYTGDKTKTRENVNSLQKETGDLITWDLGKAEVPTGVMP